MIKEDNAKIIAPFFLLISALIVGFIYQFNGSQLQDIRGRADDDANYCAFNCGGDKDPCTGTKIGDNFYDPACCGEIKNTGDPFACGNWVNRTWCFPEECSTIPEGVNRQRCSAARTSYCSKCKEHGCYSDTSIPTAAPTSQPVPTQIVIIPTSEPIPTAEILPTSPPLPTQIIRIEPTTPRTQITYTPIRYPTNPPPPTLIPTNAPFKISLPHILPPKEKVDTFITQIRAKLDDFFSKILP